MATNNSAQIASIKSQLSNLQSQASTLASQQGGAYNASTNTVSYGGGPALNYQQVAERNNQIPADTLNPNNPANQKIIFPENTGLNNYTVKNALAGITATNPAGTFKTPQQQNDEASARRLDIQQQYIDNSQPAPRTEDSYARAQKETQYLEKQQVVNDLSGKLNMITAQGEANKLSVVGQGRGIPEAIIGGQQAEMARETAIQALPVSAQLQAAQGNLEMAQQNMNTLFKIYSEDATNAYNYKNKINESVMTFLTGEEKIRMDEIQKQDERNYNLKIDQMNNAQSVANSLLGTQPGLAAQIGAIDWAKDPNAMTKFNSLSSQIRPKATGTGTSGNIFKSGGLQITGADIAEGQAKLDATRHSMNNGQADTKTYLDMLKIWTDNKGLSQDFFSKYPPKDYLLATDPMIPTYIKDKLKATSATNISLEDLQKVLNEGE